MQQEKENVVAFFEKKKSGQTKRQGKDRERNKKPKSHSSPLVPVKQLGGLNNAVDAEKRSKRSAKPCFR